jgi:hypothetical protein
MRARFILVTMLRPMKTLVFGLLLGFTITGFAQTSEPQKYEVRGVIRNEKGQVFPGLRLNFKSDKTSVSTYIDVNGNFYDLLPEGDYVLTIDSLNSDEYRLFLKIRPNYLRPEFVEFVVSFDKLICGGPLQPAPSILKSVKPTYPAAAKAVRAGGEASISVKIALDGKVSSAKGISGHPLLRRASEVAAEQFEFEASKESVEREVRLTFMFLPEQYEKPNVKRLSCPYRPLITSEAVIIQTAETRSN